MKKLLSLFFMILFVFSSAYQFGVVTCAVEIDPDVEKADIDVVYCYADLHDPTLQRGNMGKELQKNWDNNELMYSLRSVLKNIPWVRKIFIIMPNDRVKFLKAPEEISDRIVYIKDKDILGFDSASSICFEFSLWKLRDFGCSENFIYLNDDWFIGKPLKKSDFFYKDGNKIVPYVILRNRGYYGQYHKMERNWRKMQQYKASSTHGDPGFRLQRLNSVMFLYKIFNRDIRTSIHISHNALGENLTELKELYDLVNIHYEYADDCLRAKARSNNALQHQLTYSLYLINKYNRKINNISRKYIDLHAAPDSNFNRALFCINTSGSKQYTNIDYLKAKIKMEQLFPEPTEYERPDYVSNISKRRLPRRCFVLKRAG